MFKPVIFLVLHWNTTDKSLPEVLLHEAAASGITSVRVSSRAGIREPNRYTLQLLLGHVVLLLSSEVSGRKHNLNKTYDQEKESIFTSHLLNLLHGPVTVTLNVRGLHILKMASS